ncbi:tetratricopeptide repeat protein [Streptomyces sp. NBC_01497]|uniref:serine/threonine-protein kinase n=1 Tax=Streptomyces sp. NBC_01497 TaxID=2903885 RepID=UPI003FCE13D4
MYEDVGGGELYCDVCGLAPVVSPTGSLSSPPTGLAAAAKERAGTGAGFGAGTGRGNGTATGPGVGTGAGGGTGRGTGPGGGAGAAGSTLAGSESSSRSSRSSTSRRSVSGRLSRALSGETSGRSVSVISSGNSGSPSGRSRLGAGLVSIPDVPKPDPRAAVMDNAEVPERKRFCSRSDCGAPVGRSRGDRPGRTEGFCTKCGHPYSFVPKLREGDIVHGQYEIAGCLAHGGLGWIYLAVDRAVDGRWVVLKGLLDTGDADAMAAAMSERRFLAEIEHSNIVRIYNFVEHLDPRTGSLDGYIVMEYVGGKSLKEIANDRRSPATGRRDPLPVEQACAYGIEALGALGHLHSRNLLYCDFKVDNAIQAEDQLKLIDMGAVRRMDDEDSAIYGTVGYQAPEVAEVGPSVASDLYTVARTLAVLTFDFQGYTNVFVDSLPDPEHIEVFGQYESFYRLLVRATDPDPGRRFSSAEEMAEQLTGVLREVVALQSGRPRPALSTLFGPEVRVTDAQLFAEQTDDVSVLGARQVLSRRSRRSAARALPAGHVPPAAPGTAPAATALPPAGSRPGVPGQRGLLPAEAAGGAPGGGPAQAPAAPQGDTGRTGARSAAAEALRLVPLDVRATVLALPVPRVDPNDPHAGYLAGLLSSSAHGELIAALEVAKSHASGDSAEVRLREVRAHLEHGDTAAAAGALGALQARHPDEWRVVWCRALMALVTGDHATAAVSFDAIYDAFPGEPAPKLALGVCAEVLGQLDNAAEYYRLVWATDPSYVSAAFGLARVRLAAGDRQGAVATLESVPEASIHYTAARVAAVRARLRRRVSVEPLLPDLTAAADQVEALRQLGLDAVRREQLSTEVLGTALDWVISGGRGGRADATTTLLGSRLDERGLRFGLERSYRALARLAQRGEERIELVERANRFRPRTWV